MPAGGRSARISAVAARECQNPVRPAPQLCAHRLLNMLHPRLAAEAGLCLLTAGVLALWGTWPGPGDLQTGATDQGFDLSAPQGSQAILAAARRPHAFWLPPPHTALREPSAVVRTSFVCAGGLAARLAFVLLAPASILAESAASPALGAC